MKGTAIELSAFCQIQQGGRHGLSGNNFVQSGFPAYGAGGMNGFLPEAEFRESAIVLSAIGARCGKCFLTEKEWSSLANTQIILPDVSKADVRFLWYQLNDEKRWPRSGTAQPFIKPSDVKGHRVFLPPLPEQRHIAEILDQADALRAKRRAALAQVNGLTQAIFLEMFGDPVTNPMGWPAHSLGDIAEFFAGASLPPGIPFSGQRDGHFLLKVSDMNLPGNDTELNVCQEWSAKAGPRSSTCPADSVIIPKRGGAIATNKKRLSTRSSVLDPNLMAIWPRPTALSPAFLFHWFGKLDLASIQSGSSVPQLNKKDLAPLSVPTPPLGLQRSFASRAAAVDKLKASHRASLAQLDALFASLQHRAFRGEL